MLKLMDEIGKGKERTCFLHPQDKTKVIKVVHISECKQMDREIHLYNKLKNKRNISYEHIPKFHGEVATDKGTGYVFDLIENSDGSASESLHSHIKNGTTLETFYPQLDKLKAYFFTHSIIFCNDMSYEGNILVNENEDGSLKLIVIDGLGDVAFIQWANNFDYLVKRKIERRWERLMQRLKNFDAHYTSREN